MVKVPQVCLLFQRYVYHLAQNYLPLIQQITDLLTKIGLVHSVKCLNFGSGYFASRGKMPHVVLPFGGKLVLMAILPQVPK